MHHGEVVGVNALQHPFDPRLDARVVTENPKGFVRPMKIAGGRRPAETACVTQALSFGQIGLAAAQPVFGPLSFVDVYGQAIPLYDASLSITQRLTTGVMPKIFAVGAP